MWLSALLASKLGLAVPRGIMPLMSEGLGD